MGESLISGVVSGLLVAVVVVIFRGVWKEILVPWFEERVYKDARIEGEWFSLYPKWSDRRQEAITLTRHGHAVAGTIVCTTGKDEGERYDVTGSFRNMILPLVYETSDRQKTDRGTITLKLVGNARRFRGIVAAYSNHRDLISSGEVVWFRSKAELNKALEALQSEEKRLKEQHDRVKAEVEAKAKAQEESGQQALTQDEGTPGSEPSPSEDKLPASRAAGGIMDNAQVECTPDADRAPTNSDEARHQSEPPAIGGSDQPPAAPNEQANSRVGSPAEGQKGG